jgi:hypothetical protein
MSWFAKSKDHLPLTWWKGHPVYFAAVLALIGVGSMVVTALLIAVHAPLLEQLVFTFSGLVEHGRLWTVLTYVLVNPPSLWVVLTSYFLWRFGEDVEKFFGRRVFAKMFASFVLAEPLLLSLISLCGFSGAHDWPAVGIFRVEFAVFIAFATLYPRAQISLIICCVEVWLIAAIFVGMQVLENLAYHNWPGLILLTGQVGLAYGLVRYEQGRWALPSVFARLKGWRSRRHSAAVLRVVRDGADGDVSVHGVDAVLDKINRQGMASLTAKERRALEQASEEMNRPSRN